MINYITHYALTKCQKRSSCNNNPYMLKAYEPRYAEIELNEDNIFRFDNTGDYTPQGGCVDRVHKVLYRALVKEDEENTILQKIDLETGEILLEVQNYSYGHANDMTYNSLEHMLYIAHSSSTSVVYKVNPDTLEYVDTINVGPVIWGITHEPVNDVYAYGNVGSAYLSVYRPTGIPNTAPQFMYRNKPENAFTGAVRQGIDADDNYIYVALDNAYGAVLENTKGSRIMVYTWNGMFIKSIYIPIAEIEFIAVDGRTFYIGTYEGRDSKNKKSGYIYKVDFDLYPEQTNITGRPTDVSGGFNNLQRLPEGTPVRLWSGLDFHLPGTERTLNVPKNLVVTEDGPFRYLRFRFKGANDNVFDWYPVNNGIVALREFDTTAAVEDTTIRFRETRLKFNQSTQSFTYDSSIIEEIKYDKSANTTTITKNPEGVAGLIVEQIWGIV